MSDTLTWQDTCACCDTVACQMCEAQVSETETEYAGWAITQYGWVCRPCLADLRAEMGVR